MLSTAYQGQAVRRSLKAKKNSTLSLVAVKKRLHNLFAYAEYAVKYTEMLITPEVEIQFMFSLV